MSSRAAIYCVLLFLVSLVGIIRYRRLSLPFKILTWSVIMTFLTFLLDRYFVKKFHTNAPMEHVQDLEEYVFYAVIYYYLFKNVTIKKVTILSLVIVVVFFPINAIFFQPFLTTFPTNIDILAQTFYAIFSLLLFKEMLDYSVKMNIVNQAVFWFNTAMLFYATTAFFLLGLTNYFSGSTFKENQFIFYIWWVIIYIFHLLICVALLTRSRENTVAETN